MIEGGKYQHRKLIFEGNSLFNVTVDNNAVGGHYIPTNVYNNLTKSKLTFTSYAISGRTQTQIIASLATNIGPYIQPQDIVVNWEGTNDIDGNALSGAQGYANLVTCADYVQSRGGIYVACTITARDFAGDDADLMDRIDAYNALVRTNQSYFLGGIVDLASYAEFNTKADASNTTYYHADKLHLRTAAQALVITGIQNQVQTLL